jgi:hypothetical protein
MGEYEESRTSVSAEDREAVAKPALSLINTFCGSNTCPTIYRTDRGTLVVQGILIEAESAGVDLPAGEVLVEIPEQLITDFAVASGRSSPEESSGS